MHSLKLKRQLDSHCNDTKKLILTLHHDYQYDVKRISREHACTHMKLLQVHVNHCTLNPVCDCSCCKYIHSRACMEVHIITTVIWECPSFILRLFPHPVFSMQVQRGKAWEIWSRVVMSGRQRVVWHPMKNLEALSGNVNLEARVFICKAASIPFVVHNSRMGQCEAGIITVE